MGARTSLRPVAASPFNLGRDGEASNQRSAQAGGSGSQKRNPALLLQLALSPAFRLTRQSAFRPLKISHNRQGRADLRSSSIDLSPRSGRAPRRLRPAILSSSSTSTCNPVEPRRLRPTILSSSSTSTCDPVELDRPSEDLVRAREFRREPAKKVVSPKAVYECAERPPCDNNGFCLLSADVLPRTFTSLWTLRQALMRMLAMAELRRSFGWARSSDGEQALPTLAKFRSGRQDRSLLRTLRPRPVNNLDEGPVGNIRTG